MTKSLILCRRLTREFYFGSDQSRKFEIWLHKIYLKRNFLLMKKFDR
jgi:hypothetical protein